MHNKTFVLTGIGLSDSRRQPDNSDVVDVDGPAAQLSVRSIK